jgi:hypothetical protein
VSKSYQLKYPYNWGRDIVNEFVEKYARGTYFLARMLDVPAGNVRHGLIVVLCRGNSLQFESLKRLIKQIDRDPPDYIAQLDAQNRKLLYKRYLWMAQDEALDVMTEKKGLDRPEN